MLIYVVAAALCCLYVAETILTARNLRVYTTNPPSSKLLFLAEAFKLVLASSFCACEKREVVHSSAKEKEFLGLTRWLHNNTKWSLLLNGKAMFVFAVPAVCYFSTNNLAFYALQLLPAHSYILLSDLRVITTCILSYLILHNRLNKHAMSSLLLLFVGICIGHWATMPAGARNRAPARLAASSSSEDTNLIQWLLGGLVMLVYSILSASAAVYLEWIMKHSPKYRHESLNLQNIRLYISGTFLNGVFCYTHAGGAVMMSSSDMRGTHWAVVALLAGMGLVTALLIKRYGNIVKVYASCIASLLAAGISHALFHSPPPAAFYVGCLMAMVATLQLQKARAANVSVIGVPDHEAKFDSNRALGWLELSGRSQALMWLWVLLLLLSASVIPSLLLHKGRVQAADLVNSTTTGRLDTDQRLRGQSCRAGAAVSNMVPFEPTCFTSKPHELGCPKMNCSLDPSCSIYNTSCCAYLNYEMLRFVDWYLKSKCLQKEYLVVYGTALGAVRNQTILAHTSDLDLAITPVALQFLELNATRMELWQHGYSFWYDFNGDLWRMCPHLHHPSAQFQALMLKLDTMQNWELSSSWAAYVDVYLMWPVPWDTASCQNKYKGFDAKKCTATPWDHVFGTVESAQVAAPSSVAARPVVGIASGGLPDTCSTQMAEFAALQDHQAPRPGWRKYCIYMGEKPLTVVPGSSTIEIGDLTLPMADDISEFLQATYGADWRSPRTSFHGSSYHGFGQGLVRQALLTKLAITAWGNMSFARRQRRCLYESKLAATSAERGLGKYALDRLDRFCL